MDKVPQLLALSLFLLAVGTGCRNSAKNASASPAASPGAAAQAPKPDEQIAQPTQPQGHAGQALPIQVAPPASFGPDQLPTSRPAQFMVTGKAGAFLLVKVKTAPGESPTGLVSVQLLDAVSPLKPAVEDYTGNTVYALQQTGTYMVEFSTEGRKAGLDIAFLEPDDPMIDPGITPEQVSIDLGALAPKETRPVVTPYALLPDEGFLSSWPSHLAVESDSFDFHIMTVAGYTHVLQGDRRIEALRRALTEKGKATKVGALPYSLEERWCGYVTSARREVLEGEGWRGLRWIGGFGGDEDYPSCGLGYVFAGLSDDGNYLIIFRSDISHPDQKRLMPPTHVNGKPPHTWETSDPQDQTRMRLQLEKSLAATDPASFEPNLDQLDAAIRSLKLKR